MRPHRRQAGRRRTSASADRPRRVNCTAGSWAECQDRRRAADRVASAAGASPRPTTESSTTSSWTPPGPSSSVTPATPPTTTSTSRHSRERPRPKPLALTASSFAPRSRSTLRGICSIGDPLRPCRRCRVLSQTRIWLIKSELRLLHRFSPTVLLCALLESALAAFRIHAALQLEIIALRRALEHANLMAKSQVLQLQRGSRLQQ